MDARPPQENAALPDKPRRIRLSISRTLTLGLSLLFLASLGTSLWFAFDAAHQNTLQLERELSELTVEAAIREVDNHLGAAQDQASFLGALIERGEVDIDDEQRLTDLLTGALAAAPQVSGIALVRADYSVLRAGRLGSELFSVTGNWADRESVRAAMSDPWSLKDTTWRAIVWIEDFQAPHVVVAEPVFRDGQFLGAVFSVADVRALSRFLSDFDAAHQTHRFILYGRDTVLAHPSLADGYAGLSAEKPLPALADVDDHVLASIWDDAIDDMAYMLEDSWISGHVVRGPDDDYIFLFRELHRYGVQPWIIGVYFLGSEVDLPLRRLLFALAASLVVLVLAVVAGLLLARSIARPVQRLADAAQSVRQLDLDKVKPLQSSRFSELDVAVKAFDSMLAGLRWFETYVPKNLVLRLMRSGGTSVQSEEREVTVLFTDLVGFTEIGARLAPAELAELLNRHFALLADAIEVEEGTLDKYIGDSVMAFWGAPLDQPDQTARACRAARDIARSVRSDNAQRRAEAKVPLGIRIGVHTGAAIVGNIGAPGRVNYTLIGETVNIAQRLEGLGKEVSPDSEVTVLLSANTKAALEDDAGDGLEFEGLGSFVLRGRETPLEVYRLQLSDSAPP